MYSVSTVITRIQALYKDVRAKVRNPSSFKASEMTDVPKLKFFKGFQGLRKNADKVHIWLKSYRLREANQLHYVLKFIEHSQAMLKMFLAVVHSSSTAI